ncbi:MAG: pyridoxamine 5'-phosphate oxidase family protein [Acidimicrobiia bacterium]|nr:pyridoxamine 5'-phosphate oxidase family protein [Acidimicrobiia bacterium]
MSRRDQIRMTAEEADAFMAEARTLQVASTNSDGTIHLVAMWFALLDGRVAFWTYGKSQKVVNLRRNPHITVMAESGDVYEELRGVSIIGRAEIVDDPDLVLRYGLLVFEKHWGSTSDDAVRAGIAQQAAKRVVVIVEPDRVVSWDHRKLGGVY